MVYKQTDITNNVITHTLISTSKCAQTFRGSTHESIIGRTCTQNTSRKLNSPAYKPSWEFNSRTVTPVHAIITILRHTDIYSPFSKLFLNIRFNIIPPLTVPIHTKTQNSSFYTFRFIPSCYISVINQLNAQILVL